MHHGLASYRVNDEAVRAVMADKAQEDYGEPWEPTRADMIIIGGATVCWVVIVFSVAYLVGQVIRWIL